MSLAIGLTTTNTTARTLARAAALLGGARVHTEWAREAAVMTKQHLVDRDRSSGGGRGGQRTHFFRKFAQVTRPESNAARATVLIGNALAGSSGGNPLAAHYYGATIKPRDAKFLTIPVHPQAHGRRAREFTNLKLVLIGPKGAKRAVLAAVGGFGGGSKLEPTKPGTRRKGTASRLDRLEVFYLLLKQVKLRADRTVLPTAADYQAAGLRAGRRLLAELGGAAA